ncbi:MAG: hypothetical protein QOG69_2339 [Actinomycetota bacterium]|nr:hypothetical protein [Actinomycetota bacterium]
MATQVHLDYLGWRRSGLFANVTSATMTPEGRLRASAVVTLQNELPPNESFSQALTFDIVGPGDVEALKDGAVVHMVPPPGTIDFEETKCAYVELAEVDLSWRYTPELAVGLALRPWIVLVVGTPQEVQLQSDGTVTLTNTVLAAHDLARSARWAHVQDDRDHPGERMVARLLSPRDLDPTTDYVAVVVPAFAANGDPAWNAATAQVSLPVAVSWRFRTSTEGDFPTLASRLHPALAGNDLGRAPLEYTPLPARPALSVRGALAPIGGTDAAVPAAVDADVTSLTTPVIDPRRPIVGLQNYGDAWVADPTATTWGATFHVDPRHRGVAGLGLRAGIDEQDLLADAAAKQAGALDEASMRIRNLTAGLSAARSLWMRRLPSDPMRRLAIFGPSLARMMTANGTVLERVTGRGRPLPAALFSTAARRVLRSGPARTALAASGANDPRDVLVSANHCAAPPPKAPDGLVHADDLDKKFGFGSLDKLIDQAIEHKTIPFEYFEKLVQSFDRTDYSNSTMAAFDQVMEYWLKQAAAGAPVPVLGLLAILDPPTEKRPGEKELLDLLRELNSDGPVPDGDALLALIIETRTKPPDRPCAPVDLLKVAISVGDSIDPTVAQPFVVDRVLATIGGLDDQPLAIPELCPDLDIPAWQFLRDHDPNWLLPGAGTLPEDGVVAVSTNPTFVDAFLLGVNTQITSELRFRNIPMRTGCTPLRQFWARTNPATESYDDDIVGVHKWSATSALGSTDHQTPASASADLVVVFRTPLFRRYPQTIVYLTPAPNVGGEPDWDGDPDFANRLVPSFQGAITPEIVFFGFDLDPSEGSRYWVVLEEPPHGFQFFCRADTGNWDAARINTFNNANNGAEFAGAAFADPYRVMIRGSSLVPGGGP